ncbi:SUKH-4 family immunity protein [Streptomyces lunaelactis]|nr:nucleic acid/nucleotide deaminase domain-containing protein [Streptomyces lunaelactis]
MLQHFGRDGLRRFGPADLQSAHLPQEAREFLQETGVPESVAPYFRSPRPDQPTALGVTAARLSQPAVPTEMYAWPRIGGDGLAHLCVRPDGAVHAVVLVDVCDDMFVSSNLATFCESMVALDLAQPRFAASSGLAEAAAVFRELKAELRRIDEQAFAERENWWPRVLDDVRHTLNFPFSSAFEYVDASGAKQIVTEATGPGQLHPEEIIWRRLSGSGVEATQVRRVYCELEPCLMPGHYCAVWLQETFPHAEFTHSFDYGDTAASREEGLKDLITRAAEQARRQ